MTGDTTRERILQVAGPLFAERGFEEATVREICERAGANVAAVNYYFGSKERLYIETLSHVCATRPDEQIFRQWPPGTPVAEKLRHFIHSILSHLLGGSAESWEARLMMREITRPTEAGREFLREHFRRGFQYLLEILDEILPHDMPQHRRHQTALSVLGQCVYYRAASQVLPLVFSENELKEHFGVEQLAEHIAQFSLAALGLSAPLGGAGSRGTITGTGQQSCLQNGQLSEVVGEPSRFRK